VTSYADFSRHSSRQRPDRRRSEGQRPAAGADAARRRPKAAGARNTGPTAGFDARLIVRLARQPAWLLGIAAMIGGFAFQLTALRFGELALVQPILAAELLFVFGYLAVAGSRRPRLRDWLAAAAMSAGIGVFLRLAAPSGGRLHAPGSSWLLAGLVTAGVVLTAKNNVRLKHVEFVRLEPERALAVLVAEDGQVAVGDQPGRCTGFTRRQRRPQIAQTDRTC